MLLKLDDTPILAAVQAATEQAIKALFVDPYGNRRSFDAHVSAAFTREIGSAVGRALHDTTFLDGLDTAVRAAMIAGASAAARAEGEKLGAKAVKGAVAAAAIGGQVKLLKETS